MSIANIEQLESLDKCFENGCAEVVKSSITTISDFQEKTYYMALSKLFYAKYKLKPLYRRKEEN